MAELRGSLERSLESLRNFAKNPEDIGALRLARSDLHQAHGALQLVDLEGVSLVTEEVEHLFEGFEAQPQHADERAIELVGSAFRAVIQYLEELLEGAPHQPVRLFPSYRALLSLRGADRIHPADLFYPDLSIRPPRHSIQGTPLSPEEITQQRAIFERALLIYLRDDKNREAAADMQSAVEKIEATPKQGQQRAFWWVTRAFFDALSADALPTDLNVKRLAARINLQIRRLLEGSGMVAERLLRDTLFFVARSKNATAHISEVKQVYGLNHSLPDDFETERYAETNFPAVRTAKEALAAAKAAWTMVVAGEVSQIAAFSRDASALLGAAGSLNRPGLAHVAQVVASIGTELSFDPRKPAENVGLDVATALLFLEGALEQLRSLDDQFDVRAEAVVARVEASALGVHHEDTDPTWLDEISRQAQERLTMASFVAEMQSNLRNIEKILDNFFRDPMARSELPEAGALLGQIGGALSVLGHEQAGAAIRAGQENIKRFGEPGYEPIPGEFERVAESLGAVGFYIESLQHRADSGATFHFDEATGAFTADLKRHQPAPEPTEEPDPDPNFPGPGGAAPNSGPDSASEETSVEENAARHGDVAAELIRSHIGDLDDDDTRAELVSALQQVKQDALLLDDAGLKDKASAALKMLNEDWDATRTQELRETIAEMASQANRVAGHEVAAAPLPAVSAPVPIADSAVDAELLEIFLEEANEVLGNANAGLEGLKAHPANRETLTDVRRAYHTLKGSGRMVGLNAFGEAGWAMEQTFNQWLADGKPASEALLSLLAYSNKELTAWVGELQAHGGSSRQPHDIIAAAERVREGKPFEAADAPVFETSEIAASPATAASDEQAEETSGQAFAAPAPGDLDMELVENQPAARHDAPSLESRVLDAATTYETAFAEPSSSMSDAPVEETYAAPLGHDERNFAATEFVRESEVPLADLEFEPHGSHAPSARVTTADEHQWMSTEVLPTSEPKGSDAEIDFPLFDEPVMAPSLANVAQVPAVEASALPEAHVATEGGEELSHANGELTVDAAVARAGKQGDLQSASDLAFAATEVLPQTDEASDANTPRDPATDPLAAEQMVGEGPITDDLVETYIAGSDVDYSFEIPQVEAPPQERRATVLPFAPVQNARNDEYKQIGRLTISVPLYNIYLTEADELLRVLTHDFGEWRHELSRNVSEAAVRAAHSLAGTSSTVGLAVVHDLAFALEAALQTLHRKPVPVEIGEVLILEEGVESLRGMLHRFAAEIMPESDPDTTQRLYALRDVLRARHDPTTHPTAPPLDAMTRTGWSDDEAHPGAAPVAETLVEPLFADPSVPEGLEPLSSETSEEAAADRADRAADPAAVGEEAGATELLAPHALDVTESMSAMRAANLAAEHAEVDAGTVEQHTEAASDRLPADTDMDVGQVHPAIEPQRSAEPAAAAPNQGSAVEERPAVAEEKSPATLAPAGQSVTPSRALERVRDEIDAELIEIFLQEASEYMPQISENLREWQANPTNLASAQSLMRQLHTVKGSARMAGAMRLGEVVHEIETRVESGVNLHEIPPSLFDDLLAMYDRASELYDALMRPAQAQPSVAEEAPAEELHDEEPSAVIEDLPAVSSSAPAAGVAQGFAGRGAAVAGATQQVVQAVRVRADVLDRLVNQAGEVSISRSRLENEVVQIKTSLSDLTENLSRLRTQLREIEIQAETQMQSQLSMVKERERFDPLEFDRFTRLQELTRMMAESVSDVGTVQQNMIRSLDGASRDLSAQQRMTRDLQQDLMRVRMVPFSSVSERLYRVVRQSAKEVDKRVNLDIRGGGVEIDRSVLERMAAPFEHLLRNAVVHGIEPRDQRAESGKTDTGELLVEVRQEGNEIVLVFSDDGQGLNTERIRDKARAVGLIGGDEELGDARVADLIFQPGFTTASEVTELAGRGFGMDVVRAEAGGLGGRVSVDSTRGKGTRFTINLPLTLAVTQVVLVMVAGRTFAIPSVLVEQVQQLRPQPLAQAYNDGHIAWLNQPVRLRFLAGLLGETDRSPIAQRYSPVLILRSGGERVAVHVDEVIGNQEVVVKNIGPQLARMSGIAGATVLGSGDIVLILNPVQLAQVAERAQTPTEALVGGAVAELITQAPVTSRAEPVAGLETLPTVMVVDDSLTVRRVTQRLLTREGYQVVLAKDGVDALQQLQDYTPDVMLVDIEMPRMDGFDLTRNVRGDERYNAIPIIMITSRTADKHREFARELGVNVYLGKPYQEDELLGHIASFTGAKRRATA
jgi:chemosensory pili system protein ChpA (sensor histidine kinase/response regulator)